MQNRTPTIAAFVAALTVFVPGSAHADEFVAHRAINEGGDTRPCVTYHEANIVGLDIRRDRVRKIVDTDGEKISRDAFEELGLAEALGVDPEDVYSAPRKYREVRLYPVCLDPGNTEDSFYLVEYDTRGYRTVQTFFQ